jgi:3-dehydrosphinganine reductase
MISALGGTMAGKVVFVTGGASGIGLAAAREVAARGAHVVIFNRTAAAADVAVRQVWEQRHSPGQRISSVTLDVAERAQVIEGFKRAARDTGAPDLVLHMAGVGGIAPLLETPFEMFDEMMRINVCGTRNVAEAAAGLMRGRSGGHIVLAGSLGGFIPVYGYTSYGTSKFAVVGFAQCLRFELAPLGIALSCFCPGEVDTPGLAGERARTHPATLAIKALGGTMTTEAAVKGLLHGVERRQFLIIPGARSKLIYWLSRLTPLVLWNWIADLIVAPALRRAVVAEPK